MKLSTRARYCLRMMVEIARETREGGTVSLSSIAGKTGISRRYLEQLAIPLKNASLIRGTAGKAGGYTLTDAAGNITAGRIIEAAIGPVNIVECVDEPEMCIKSDLCECRPVYELINRRIKEVLYDISLEDLLENPGGIEKLQGH